MINGVLDPLFQFKTAFKNCASMSLTDEEEMWIQHLDKPLASKLRSLEGMPVRVKNLIDDWDEELQDPVDLHVLGPRTINLG